MRGHNWLLIIYKKFCKIFLKDFKVEVKNAIVFSSFWNFTECWILSKGEPTKISKIVREMVEQYIYLQSEQTPSIRLISIPTKPVDDETLYFDLPEKYEDDKVN